MLRHLPTPDDERLIVGATTGDDAAVWRLDDDRALVFTTDFITPIVDDARTWGRIAATNAVSDVYAMGGRPLLALNLVAWNSDELPFDLLAEVLSGSSDVAAAGAFVIGGGHTIDDPIPKFGLAVIGEVHPDQLLTNGGFRAGQTLILTKPLGIGIISTAVKGGHELVQADPEVAPSSGILHRAIESMTRLNAEASSVALDAGATGATDVTGFGLLGHLGRAALESGVDVVVETDSVPVIDGVRELAAAGMVPGGTRRNLDAVADRVEAVHHSPTAGDPSDDLLILADAQTSGGLVFGCPPERVDDALARLRTTGHTAAAIGSVVPGGTVRPNEVGSIRVQ